MKWYIYVNCMTHKRLINHTGFDTRSLAVNYIDRELLGHPDYLTRRFKNPPERFVDPNRFADRL